MKTATNQGVLLLIDFDNFFTSLYNDFGPTNLRLEERVEALIEWIKSEIGPIVGMHGWVFAPEHLSHYHKIMFLKHGFKFIICPKRANSSGDTEDTVDENIIWFSELMMRHPDVGIICLVSGDSDFVPLFQRAEQIGIKRALAPPTLNSLAKDKSLTDLIDNHPLSGKKMVLRLDLI